jgi:hypothetical protein
LSSRQRNSPSLCTQRRLCSSHFSPILNQQKGVTTPRIRKHTSTYISIRQHTSTYVSIRQHTSAYVSIRQHTSAYVNFNPEERLRIIFCVEIVHATPAARCSMSAASKEMRFVFVEIGHSCYDLQNSIRQHTSVQHTSAYVSVRQHTSAYVSIRQHTSAYVSIRQHTSGNRPLRPRETSSSKRF